MNNTRVTCDLCFSRYAPSARRQPRLPDSPIPTSAGVHKPPAVTRKRRRKNCGKTGQLLSPSGVCYIQNIHLQDLGRYEEATRTRTHLHPEFGKQGGELPRSLARGPPTPERSPRAATVLCANARKWRHRNHSRRNGSIRGKAPKKG